MKKLVLSLSVIGAALTASASDYPYMAIQKADGSASYVKTDGLSFTVADGKLTATNSEGSTVFQIAELKSMVFATDMSGVEENIAVCGDQPVEVYTVAGVAVGSFESADAARSALTTPGLYLLKNNRGTAKILVK